MYGQEVAAALPCGPAGGSVSSLKAACSTAVGFMADTFWTQNATNPMSLITLFHKEIHLFKGGFEGEQNQNCWYVTMLKLFSLLPRKRQKHVPYCVELQDPLNKLRTTDSEYENRVVTKEQQPELTDPPSSPPMWACCF